MWGGKQARGESLRDELARICAPTPSPVLTHLHSLKGAMGRWGSSCDSSSRKGLRTHEELRRECWALCSFQPQHTMEPMEESCSAGTLLEDLGTSTRRWFEITTYVFLQYLHSRDHPRHRMCLNCSPSFLLELRWNYRFFFPRVQEKLATFWIITIITEALIKNRSCSLRLFKHWGKSLHVFNSFDSWLPNLRLNMEIKPDSSSLWTSLIKLGKGYGKAGWNPH